jgi:branched-chain amino acid transport system permease protein
VTAGLRDDYFVIATFSLQLVFSNLCENLLSVTRGPLGIPGIPALEFAGSALPQSAVLGVALVFLAVVGCVAARLAASPFGRVLHAIREDDVLTRSWGKDDRYFKSVVFAASAAISAGAGALYAAYTSYIDPSTFTISQSILILSMVVIGGAGRPWGPVLGAALLVVLPELLRAIGLPDDVASNIRQLLYGAALVAIAMLRPSGLVTASANRKQVG